MTKAEFNRRLLSFQQELKANCDGEVQRHNKALGDYRSAYRAQVKGLQDEFTSTADESVVRDRTVLRPA